MKSFKQCTWGEKIERYEQAYRVLQQLPPKARRELFDMSTWGEKTECGTVACAGGHCGMDPWFMKKGLVLFGTDETNITPNFDQKVKEFFGDSGFDDIFTGPSDTVAQVQAAIRRKIKALRRAQSGVGQDEGSNVDVW